MELNRKSAVEYLNHRLKIEKEHSSGYFNEVDLEFIINFIYEETDKMVKVEDLVSSIERYERSCYSWMERLYNHLVWKFDVNIETVKPDIFSTLMSGSKDSLKIVKYN